MIYVSVQKVLGRGGRQGINRYYYRHPGAAGRTSDGDIDPRGIAGRAGDPGELVN